MSTPLLRAASGQEAAVDDVAPEEPTSYPTGGFSVRSSLGRIDDASVSADDGDWEARVTAVGSGDRANFCNVQVYSQDGSGEAADGTDLSDTSFLLRTERL